MIDRYLLRILLTVSIFCVGLTNSYSQVRDDANKAFRQKIDRELDAILKGARDPEVISSLNAFYCSDDGPADVFLDPTILPPGTTEIKWYVFVADASGDISISSVVEDIGSYPNNGLRFFPQRVPEEHRNKPIVLSYQFRIGIGFEGGSNDYTFVLKRPEAFNFAHNVEMCHGESTSLTLSGSENGVSYFLYKDGVQYRPFPATGNGGTLVFTNITEAGVYTVTALNQFSPPASSNIYRCEATMTGSATVVVNPLPVPVTASDKSAYCEGETINLFGGPDAMVSYTWEYPDGTIVTERNPVIASSVRTNHNGSYTLTVEDANGCVGTTTLNIVVNERPQISPIADLEVCEDDAITVSPTVTGGAGPYTYLWEKGAITVATSATLSIPVATLADAGTYTLTVTDNNGCGSSSESFDVIVNPRPVIDNISNSGPVCVGAMVQLTVEVSGGNGIYSFAWNGPDGFSSTEQNPEIGPVTLASAGIYTVTVTDGEGCERTAQTTVVVNDLPLATLTGAASYCEGGSETYIAGGGDFYTFFLNGTEVQARSNSNAYNTLNSLAAGSHTLMVEVEDANGCIDQETYAFIIYPEPEATIAFDATAVCEGGSANLQITLTTGTTPWSLVYNDGAVNVPVSGIVGATYSAPVTPTADLTYTLVSVEDANGCSANIGSSATLLVNAIPTVTVESSNDPSNQVCVDGSITLTAKASGGSGTYVYQWYKAGAEIVGATASTYTIVGTQLADAGEYSVVVRDTDNGITCESAPASLTVDVTFATAALTGAASYCEGGSETYIAGGGEFYTFFLNGTEVQARSISNAYNTLSSLAAGSYTLMVEVEDANGCTDQETYAFIIYPEPEATIAFDATAVCEGGSANLQITLTTGTTPWSLVYNDGAVNVPVSGIVGATYSAPVTPTADLTYTLVSVEDANGCSANIGSSATLLVNELPIVTVESSNDPSNQVCVDGSITLTAKASGGSGTYVYQWYKAGAEIVGATASTYTIVGAQLADAGEYSVVVRDTDNGITCESAPASLTVDVTFATAALTGAASYCEGGSETYIAGGGDFYTFFLNGTEVQARSISNTYNTLSSLAAGSYTLMVEVEDANGCIDQETYAFIIYPEPEATIAFDAAAVCEGGSANLQITLTTGTTPWSLVYNDGAVNVPVSGIVGATYSAPVTPTADLTYTLVSVEDANGCSANIGSSATLLVNELPIVTVESSNDPSNQVCVDGSITLTAKASGGSGTYVYQWYKAGAEIVGATASTYTIVGTQLADAGEYSVVVRDTDNGITCESAPASLTVDVTFATAALTGAASYCEGGSETYIAGGGEFYTFFLNGTEVQARSISNAYNTLSSLAAGSYTLMVEVEDANGCTDQETYAFIIYPEPEATIAFDATAVCEGGSANLQITLTTGTTPWSLVYNDGAVNVPVSGIVGATYSAPVTPTADLTYTLVSVEDANGCSANIGSSATLLVNELPIVTVESSNDPSNQVCVDGSITLTAKASGGSGSYVYQWYKAGAEIVGATASTYTIVGAQLADAGEYSVVVRDTDNGITCESAPASLTVDVTFATATLIGSTNVCEGTSETYVAGGGLSFSFILYEATSAIIETGPASADNTYSIPNNLAKGHYTLQVIVEDASGCTDDELLTFTVMEAPSNSITYSSTDICDGENITVTATSGYSSYDFTVNGASVQTGTNNVYSSNEWTNGDIVKVAITLGSCAVESAETTITVRDIPTVTLLSDQTDNMACLGETVSLTASGADQYAFEVNGVQVQAPGATATYSAVFADGDQIIVYGEAANACVSSDTLRISVNTPVATLELSSAELCVNDALTLTAGGGVQYEFFRNGVSLGAAGSASTFEVSDPLDGDEFHVLVVNEYGCEATSSTLTITVNPIPTVVLDSDIDEICEGETIIFEAVGTGLVNYTFYRIRGGVESELQSGTDNQLSASDFEEGDLVYVVVSDGNMCSNASSGITVTVHELPVATISVLPSNQIGEGDNVTVEASGGDEYLYLVNGLPYDGDPNGWTTEASIIISDLVDGDVLTIKARSSFGCEDTSEPVIIETTPYPLPFNLLPPESQYCSYESGVRLYLSSYESIGVVYQLYRVGTPDVLVDITPSPVEGMLGWDNVPEGTYRVKATRIPIGLELGSNIVTVTKNQVPVKYNMTPIGTQTSCPVEISLDNSEAGINYYLMLNGSVFAGPLTGNGIPLNFGSYNIAGSYTVYAVDSVSGCSADMNGVLDFDIDPMPVKFVLSSSPTDGQYCEGEEGVRLLLNGSTSGVEYQVYRGTSAVGEPYIGDSEAMTFGPFTEEGTYRVMAAGGGGGCLVPMDGDVEIRMNRAPDDKFDVVADNDGHFCLNTDGVEISLSGQQEGVVYQLWFNGEEKGPSFIGNSNPELSFGLQNEAGEYIVMGTMPETGCPGEIGRVELFPDLMPEQFELGGDDSYCVGGAAVLQLSGSQSGVKYALYFEGAPTGDEEVGDGGLVSFTVDEDGEYYVMATIDNEHTSCEVQIGDAVTVNEKPLPETNGITFNIVDGTDCDNGAIITVNNPQVGVYYELYRLNAALEPVATGNSFIGDDSGSMDFAPVVDKEAEYVVHASLDGCELPFFSNEFEVNIAGAIARFSVSGNADLCEGDGFGVLNLDGSESGVSYTLINKKSSGQVYPPKTGDGSPLEWNDISDEGLYVIEASNGVDACTQTMLGEFDLQFHRLPESYIVSASHPVFCAGSSVEISLKTTEAGVSYSLFRSATPDGPKALVATQIGDGGDLVFTGISVEGYFSAIATSPEGCTSSMNAILPIEEKPVIDVSAVSISDNDFCSEDATTVVLENTKADVLHSLYDGATLIASASPVADGESVEFEDIVSGTYRVLASYDGACEVVINETYEVVSTWTSPVQPVVISEAAYCQSEAIVEIETSELGVSYFLVEEDAIDLAAVLPGTFKIDGTGEAIVWDLSSLALGHQFFTVVAQSSDGCVTLSEMYGINLSECAPPIGEYYIDIPEGGLAYCSDEDGVIITVYGTTADAYYELVEVGNEDVPLQVLKGNGGSGSVPFINPVKGTGEYTIIVQDSDELFTGGAFWVTENPTPNAYMLSSGGSVGVHEITLSGSDIATSYYLTVDLTVALEDPDMIGNGEELNFGTVDVAGDYHVLAVSDAGCIRLMDGVSTIYQSQLVAVADTLYLGPGELVGTIDLGLNDSEYYIPGLDEPGEIGNIRFSHIPDANTMLDIDINSITGWLTYRKSPSFYGKDSLSYLIENINVPGRMATAKVIIMVGNKDFDEERSFLLPNAFSPNGDDINEKFIISGLGETEESSLEVFNRWGTIVYRSEGKRYDNSWDGTSNMGTMVSIGKELPSGVYFYVFEVVKNIEGEIQKRRYNGFVELRR